MTFRLIFDLNILKKNNIETTLRTITRTNFFINFFREILVNCSPAGLLRYESNFTKNEHYIPTPQNSPPPGYPTSRYPTPGCPTSPPGIPYPQDFLPHGRNTEQLIPYPWKEYGTRDILKHYLPATSLAGGKKTWISGRYKN